MFFQRKKDKEVDVASLNEILEIGKRLIHIIYIVTIVVLVLLATSILREWKLFSILGELLVVISPLFIGIVIAWLFDPFVTWLQSKKIPRILGCIIAYLLLITILFTIMYAFIPLFIDQLGDLLEQYQIFLQI